MNSYKFFSNKECEFFPCHNTGDIEGFNCLFCFCPLYTLGEFCGGNFRYNKKGIKDCSDCNLPHKAENYEYIMSKFKLLSELARRR